MDTSYNFLLDFSADFIKHEGFGVNSRKVHMPQFGGSSSGGIASRGRRA